MDDKFEKHPQLLQNCAQSRAEAPASLELASLKSSQKSNKISKEKEESEDTDDEPRFYKFEKHPQLLQESAQRRAEGLINKNWPVDLEEKRVNNIGVDFD